MLSGGGIVVASLLQHEVDTVYCVPGESYLAVLDALYDVRDRIRLVACRHESGAAFMAAASARLRGRAGVVLVTRGPGATNASIALHVARQSSIPLVVAVGQVPRRNLGRDAFQEVDYEAFFRPLVKHVEQVNDAAVLPAAMARAFAVAESGRPGPVVLALPEDVLSEPAGAAPWPAESPLRAPLAAGDQAQLSAALAAAQRPLLLVGGSTWSDAACANLLRFAAVNELPVMSAFRRQDICDNTHACFAGYLGYGAHAQAAELAAQADCVLVIGARLDDPTTAGYTLFDDGVRRTLAHVHPEAEVLGRNYSAQPAIVADVAETIAALAAAGRVIAHDTRAWRDRLRRAYLDACRPPACAAALDPGAVMQALNQRLDDTAIVCIDAGNFTVWPQRYRQYRRPGRLLAPINGAMGHAVPSAIGAALTCPARQVVACVGDGGMLMTGMELATAAKYGARPVVLVFNNSKYGTIESHQDRRYPGRRIGNDLVNPDFAAMAESFGLYGQRVERTAAFAPALDAALTAGRAAVIDLIMPSD